MLAQRLGVTPKGRCRMALDQLAGAGDRGRHGRRLAARLADEALQVGNDMAAPAIRKSLVGLGQDDQIGEGLER